MAVDLPSQSEIGSVAKEQSSGGGYKKVFAQLLNSDDFLL
jgi:hypothetical protein